VLKYTIIKDTPMKELSKRIYQKSKMQRSQKHRASATKPKVGNKIRESVTKKNMNSTGSVNIQYKADIKPRPRQSYNSSLQNSGVTLKGNIKYGETYDQ
jgi:hypothetical protein